LRYLDKEEEEVEVFRQRPKKRLNLYTELTEVASIYNRKGTYLIA
jgi:hypothetical protein